MTVRENATLGKQIQHAARLLEILRDFMRFSYIYQYSLACDLKTQITSIQIQYNQVYGTCALFSLMSGNATLEKYWLKSKGMCRMVTL